MKHAPNAAFANPGEPAQIDRYNDLAKAKTKTDPLFKYFDMDAPVLDAKGKVQGDLFEDGEHFNARGYALINPALQKMLVSLNVPHSN
jgi:lysophospholipase L1-like esterase